MSHPNDEQSRGQGAEKRPAPRPNEETIRDLSPKDDHAEKVKGGIPKQPDPG